MLMFFGLGLLAIAEEELPLDGYFTFNVIVADGALPLQDIPSEASELFGLVLSHAILVFDCFCFTKHATMLFLEQLR